MARLSDEKTTSDNLIRNEFEFSVLISIKRANAHACEKIISFTTLQVYAGAFFLITSIEQISFKFHRQCEFSSVAS
jgi:hypothetical protein